jgi:hypothetical protein
MEAWRETCSRVPSGLGGIKMNSQPFAFVSRKLLPHPPIRHKNSPSEAALLTPFAFALAWGFS